MTPLRQQTAVLVAGAPGAGKSTVAVVVARALRAALIDIDVSFGPIVPLLAGHARGVVRDALYEALLDAAAGAARTGGHVVVAAPFTRERRDPRAWEHVRDRFARQGAEAALVWVRVPEATLIERLAARGAARDQAKLAHPADWLREAAPEIPPNVPHFELDGTRDAQAAARALLAELAARERSTVREACSFSA